MVSKFYQKDAGSDFILGNEALSRGLIEAGLQLVACYPGTPTSDILPTMSQFSKLHPELNLYTEWSTNEAVALEVAAAAAQTGIRCAFTAKHVGLNVAMDAFMTLAYSGVIGGLVLIIGDDPSLHSSQNEQDTRYLAKAAAIPVIEPSDPQECYDYSKLAMEISEKFQTPVVLRITTRVAHARQSITFKEIIPQPRMPVFKRDVPRLVNVPAMAKQNHHKLIEKSQKLREFSNTFDINFSQNLYSNDFGIITSGVAYKHSMDALQFLNLDIPILKVSFYPVPEEIIIDFLKGLSTVFVIEEVEPILENDVRVIAQVYGIHASIVGKREGYTPYFGELNTSVILNSLQELLQFDKRLLPAPQSIEPTQYSPNIVFNRPPVLCAGCPHRSSFLEVKKAFGRKEKDVIYASDIGCYALGLSAPANAADTILCMGASIGMASGFNHSGIDRPVVAIIGDSTFWHSGLPGLANAVYNMANITILIVDNKTTAMTGQQENPSTGITALGKHTKKLSIEKVCEAMGVPTIVIDPWETETSQRLIKEHIQNYPDGPKVIVSRRDCIADALRRTVELKPLTIDKDLCVGCGVCVDQLGCPAIIYNPDELDEKHPKPIIDPNLCSSCSVCLQICPVDAIKGTQIIYQEKE